MRKVIITLSILFILTLAAVISGKTEMRKASETVADGAVITAELNTLSTTETAETEPVTVRESETETTTEATTQNSLAEQGKTYLGRYYITGYTAEEGFPRGSATASGAGVREGYCALNNEQRKVLGIQWGDYIYVEGLGRYQVMDCTADYIYNTVDIWVPTNEEAYSITGYYDVYI